MSEESSAVTASSIGPGIVIPANDAAAAVEFPRRSPSLLRSAWVVVFLVGGLGGLADAFSMLRVMNDGVSAIVWISLAVEALLLSILFFALHLMLRRRKIPPIVLLEDEIVLPRNFGWRRRVKGVRLPDIWSIRTFSYGGWGWLTVVTRKWPFLFVYAISSFTGPAAVDEVILCVRQRIEAMPGGEQRLAEIDRRMQPPEWADSVHMRGTLAVIATLVLVFILELVTAAPTWPPAMVRLGGSVPALVTTGEWYRLVTANLLHANARHLMGNACGLLVLGAVVESSIGSARFFIVLLASFLGGLASSALAARWVMSVGASSGVCGLLAGAWVLWLKFSRSPSWGRRARAAGVLVLLLNLPIAIVTPGIDNIAHLGGFITGGAITWALYAFGCPIGPRQPLSRSGRAALVLLSAVFAIGVELGIRGALHDSEADELQVLSSMASAEDNAYLLNHWAWGYAKQPASSRRALGLAGQLAEKAVAAKPDEAQLQDTLATVYYRLGRFDEAIDTEWQAFYLDAKPYFAAQLGRFLRARQGSGPPLLRDGARESDVKVRIERSGEGETPSRWIAVDLPRGLSQGVTVFAHVREAGGREVGLLSLELGAMGARSLRLADHRNASLSYLPGDAEVDVAMIAAARGGREAGETWWRFDPVDPKVASLP